MRGVPRGTVVTVSLDPTVGNEQWGTRPCIVVSDPDVSGGQRFPLMAVVPLTRTPGAGVLYPRLDPGRSGLSRVSYALIDQVRSVDKKRIRAIGLRIAPSELDSIDTGLRLFLGLEQEGGEA
jgi:mRNA interferase MazF